MNKAAALVMLAGCAASLADIAIAEPSRAGEQAPDSLESLRQQLAAQKAINEQLRTRVDVLERQLAATRRGGEQAVLGLDATASKPPVEPETANTAIEEALVNKGLVLLPAGTFRLTPSATWSHSGSGDDRYDSYSYALSLEAGLPWGMSAALRLPYIQRDYPLGQNDGMGDLSVVVGKRLTRETERLPSVVARLTYRHDNGEDAFDAVPIGYGFPSLTATLSAVKRIEPVALYGNLSYTHAWPKTVTYLAGDTYRVGRIAPSDVYGAGLGVSLAATPDISLDAGVSFDFLGSDTVEPLNGDAYRTAFATAGYFELGADFVLVKDLFLSLSAAAGVTDEADDFVFSVALPYRF